MIVERSAAETKKSNPVQSLCRVQSRPSLTTVPSVKILNGLTTASARWLVDYDINDRTRNNGAKLIAIHFNASVAQLFYPIKITTTWNALPYEVTSSRTVNSRSRT